MEKAIDPQQVLLQHLRPSPSSAPGGSPLILASVYAAGDSAAYQRNACSGDDVVVVAAYRTAICKSKRGGFKDTYPEELLTAVLKALLDKTSLNPNEVSNIVVGTVLAPGHMVVRVGLQSADCVQSRVGLGGLTCLGPFAVWLF